MSSRHVPGPSRGRASRTLLATALSAVVLLPWGHGAAGAATQAATPEASISERAATAHKSQFPNIKTWNRLAQCESGRRWHINTGNGYYGGLQFSSPTWRGYGGGKFANYAHRASKVEQIKTARKVRQSQGWGAWPHCSQKLGLGKQ